MHNTEGRKDGGRKAVAELDAAKKRAHISCDEVRVLSVNSFDFY